MAETNVKYNDLPLTNFPEAEDTWSRMSDLSASLLSVASQYEELYSKGNIDTANALLVQYPDLKDALFTPERWNEIRDAIIALQRFFLSDVDNMITEVAQSTIGIDDNATGINANTNAYSVTKINELLNAIATKFETVKTATFSTSGWSSTSPYSQTVSVVGITASDKPVVGIYIPDNTTAANVKLQNKAYNCIDRAVTGTGTITAYCYNKKPTTDFQIQIKGV